LIVLDESAGSVGQPEPNDSKTDRLARALWLREPWARYRCRTPRTQPIPHAAIALIAIAGAIALSGLLCWFAWTSAER
jgi:hypothetical protein